MHLLAFFGMYHVKYYLNNHAINDFFATCDFYCENIQILPKKAPLNRIVLKDDVILSISGF